MPVEINEKLLVHLRLIAEEQGRPLAEVLEEAVLRYLEGAEAVRRDPEREPDIGEEIGEIYVERPGERLRDPFLALLDRMSSRFDLDEDEAMRIAVEEQHAFRRESAERKGAER